MAAGGQPADPAGPSSVIQRPARQEHSHAAVKMSPALSPLLLLLCQLIPCGAQMRVWQITDVHVEDMYHPTGSPASWCRSGNASADVQPHWYGQNGCGLPWRTVQLAADFMASTEPSAEAVLWTGDTPPHWRYPDWNHVFPKLSRVTSILQDAFPNAQIIPALGNRDAFPTDQFPADNSSFYEEYLIQSGWAEVLPEDTHKTFKTGGYYRVDVGRIRFLVLNTNLYYKKNRLVGDPVQNPDPAGQFAWLESQLNQTQQGVVVVGHISPGFPHWNLQHTSLKKPYNDRLVALLSARAPGPRLANIFGHEHIDTFQIVYREVFGYERRAGSYLMAPSLYPGTLKQDTNPGVRLYLFYPVRLNSYVQYHFDIEAANRAHRQDPDVDAARFWNVTYSTREAFGLNDLTTPSMEQLFNAIRRDRKVWEQYWRYASGGHGRQMACNDTCKMDRLCVMSNQLDTQMERCRHGAASLPQVTGLLLAAASLLTHLLAA